MGNADKLQCGSSVVDIVSPSMVNGVVETIGQKCAKVGGYAIDDFFLAKNSGIQYFYRATAAIIYNSTVLTVNTNCVQTTLSEILKSANTNISSLTTNQGNLANLTTTEKSNLVGAVNEVDSDIQTLTNLSSALGLSVVNGEVCQTYNV